MVNENMNIAQRLTLYAIGILCSLMCLAVLWKLHPLAAVGIPIALMIFWAYLYWSVTGPLFFTVALYLRPGEMIHPVFEKLKVGKVTAIACLGFWFLHFVFFHRRHIPRDVLVKLMLALTTSILICSIKSTVPAWSQQFLSEVWIKLVILFLAISSLVVTPGSLAIYVMTMNILTLILAIMGIHKGLTASPDQLVEGNRVGLGTLLGDPNDYGQMLLTSGVAYYMQGILIAPRKIRKILFTVGLLILLGGVFFARSRGAFLGFAGASMVVMKGYLSTRTLMIAGVGMGGLGAIFMKMAERATAHSADGGVDESAQGRLDAWKAAIRMFLKNPLFGVGYECYPWNYLAYVSNPVDWKPKAVHSSWFKALAELGLSGVLFFYSIVFISLRRAYQLEEWARLTRLRKYGLWYHEVIYRALFPSLVAWCIAGTFLSNSFTWFLYITIAILIASTVVKKELQEKIEAGQLPILAEYA